MYQIETNKGIVYINSIDDLDHVVNYDLAEAIKEIHMDEICDIQNDYVDLEQEFKSYEASNESFRSCMNDTMDSLKQLIEDIENCKRMNRDKILSSLEIMYENIYNEI